MYAEKFLTRPRMNLPSAIKMYTLFYIFILLEGTCGVIVIIVENVHGDRVQILNKAVCISHEKGVHSTILLPTMGK